MLKPFIQKNRAAFIPFVVPGYPSIEFSHSVIDALIEEGADLLEIAVPFSDAMADGPVIQEASEKASFVLNSVFETLDFASAVHRRHPQIPLILFTYFNPLIKVGLQNFANAAATAGISAVLVVDLPPEEATEYCNIMQTAHLKTVFLCSPTTSALRVQKISAAASAFVYYISRVGVTGEQLSLSNSLESDVKSLKRAVKSGVAVGFGISNALQAQTVARWSDAVVVGSVFVRLAKDRNIEAIRSLAREISKAVRLARSIDTP